MIQEARREHANQDMVASSSHVAFATMTLWADHVPAELLAKTKRAITQSPRDVFILPNQAVIAIRTTERDVGGLHCRRRERGGGSCDRTWSCGKKRCLEGLWRKCWFGPSLSSSSARQVIVSLPRHRCCCISKRSVRMSAHTEAWT